MYVLYINVAKNLKQKPKSQMRARLHVVCANKAIVISSVQVILFQSQDEYFEPAEGLHFWLFSYSH